MPEERDSGVKVKIFLALFLIFICVLLIVYAYNFINVNKDYIRKESKTSNDCLSITFDVIRAKYENNNLLINVKNLLSSGINIDSVSVKLGNETQTKEITIAPAGQKDILFENVKLSSDAVAVFPNNCGIYAKTVYVKRV